MPSIKRETALADLLKFDPSWWYDPVPWWFVDQLDRGVLKQLAQSQLELQKTVLESQRAILDAQIKGLNRSMEIISKIK